SLPITVPVLGSLNPQPTSTFAVNLTNARLATLVASNAVGTIFNDVATPGRLHHFDCSPVSDPQLQTVAFPVTLIARDYFGGIATNIPWPVHLSAQTTNVLATNLDFEQPTLAPWTPFNYTTYPNRIPQQALFDVAGLGQPSSALHTIANA